MDDRPGDVERSLNFSLDRPQKISSHLLQELREQNEQPVLKIFSVNGDEIHQRLQEHTEHLKSNTSV